MSNEKLWLKLSKLSEELIELEKEEDILSYWRRLFHGRIDIIMHHLKYNETIHDKNGEQFESWIPLSSMLDKSPTELVAVLAASEQFTGVKKIPKRIITPDVVSGVVNINGKKVPKNINVERLWSKSFTHMNKADLEHYLDELCKVENKVSTKRAQIHKKIDDLNDKIFNLYKTDPTLALRLLS